MVTEPVHPMMLTVVSTILLVHCFTYRIVLFYYSCYGLDPLLTLFGLFTRDQWYRAYTILSHCDTEER